MTKQGFTLVELLVVIGIIAVLIAILLPALNKIRAAGLRVACASNVRQLVLFTLQYAQDNQGQLPRQPSSIGGLSSAIIGDWQGDPSGIGSAYTTGYAIADYRYGFTDMWSLFMTYGGLHSSDPSNYAPAVSGLGTWMTGSTWFNGYWSGLGPGQMPSLLLCPANNNYGPTYRIGYSYTTGGSGAETSPLIIAAKPMSIQNLLSAAKARRYLSGTSIPGGNPTIWCDRLVSAASPDVNAFNADDAGGPMETWGHGVLGSSGAGGNCGHIDGSVSWYALLPGNATFLVNTPEVYVYNNRVGVPQLIPCDCIYVSTDICGAIQNTTMGADTFNWFSTTPPW